MYTQREQDPEDLRRDPLRNPLLDVMRWELDEYIDEQLWMGADDNE